MKQAPFEPGKYYHVFNRGNNREKIFYEERNYLYFLQKVKYYLLPICRILAYCLLPNHFHLVIQIKELEELPAEHITGRRMIHQPFSNLFNSYSKSINKVYGRSGSLFQEHLHRIEIETEEYLIDAILYTHLNAETHGLICDFRSYPHSSYKAFLSENYTALSRKEVFEWFGGKDNFLFCHRIRRFKNQRKLQEIVENDG